MKNPYKVLGVPENALDDEITSAYKKLAFKYHPDRNGGDARAGERFKAVTEAREMLKPENRKHTDKQLRLSRIAVPKPARRVAPIPKVQVSPEAAAAISLGLLGGVALAALLEALLGDDA